MPPLSPHLACCESLSSCLEQSSWFCTRSGLRSVKTAKLIAIHSSAFLLPKPAAISCFLLGPLIFPFHLVIIYALFLIYHFI